LGKDSQAQHTTCGEQGPKYKWERATQRAKLCGEGPAVYMGTTIRLSGPNKPGYYERRDPNLGAN